jgi:enoyl-CoA hydratase/carnithine racemase
MLKRWAAFLSDAQTNDDIRAVVVRGAGDAFCSGVDLDDFATDRATPYSDKTMLTDKVHVVARAVEALDKPYIAAVNGVAVGAGMDMALMADWRIATETARFSAAYIRVGLLPGDGGCYLLPRIVGKGMALQLLLTGEFVDAEESLRIGLVNAVHPQAEFDAKVDELLARIVAAPPLATRLIKRALLHSDTMTFAASLDLISSHQAIIQSTEDSREAMAAFKERRVGVYNGR